LALLQNFCKYYFPVKHPQPLLQIKEGHPVWPSLYLNLPLLIRFILIKLLIKPTLLSINLCMRKNKSVFNSTLCQLLKEKPNCMKKCFNKTHKIVKILICFEETHVKGFFNFLLIHELQGPCFYSTSFSS